MKIFKKILSILISALLVFATIVCGTVSIKTIQGKEPSFLGMRCFYIVTGSMEPTIPTGAAVVVKKCDEYEVGDVITFVSTDSSIYGYANTHRIISITEENGSTKYQTKGDANNTSDYDLVDQSQVYGKVIWSTGSMLWLGTIIGMITTPFGFALSIMFPMLIIAVIFIKDFKNAYEEETQRMAEEQEELERKLKELDDKK